MSAGRTIYSQIFSKNIRKLHRELGDLPFLLRYKGKLLLKDHYRHLQQLLPIYEVLEKKLKELKITIPNEFSELLNRSAKIKKDLDYLRPHISGVGKDKILSSTQTYVSQIEKEQDAEKILGHFFVRILGDLHGGQRLKNQVVGHYESHNLVQENEYDGASFFVFSDVHKDEFIAWIEKEYTNKNITNMISAVTEAFKQHGPIFKELEATRTEKHCPQFFSRKVLTVVTTVAVAAVAAMSLTQ